MFKLTDAEYKAIVKEIENRVLDIHSIKHNTEKLFNKKIVTRWLNSLDPNNDKIDIILNTTFVCNDLIQMLARVRRKK